MAHSGIALLSDIRADSTYQDQYKNVWQLNQPIYLTVQAQNQRIGASIYSNHVSYWLIHSIRVRTDTPRGEQECLSNTQQLLRPWVSTCSYNTCLYKIFTSNVTTPTASAPPMPTVATDRVGGGPSNSTRTAPTITPSPSSPRGSWYASSMRQSPQ